MRAALLGIVIVVGCSKAPPPQPEPPPPPPPAQPDAAAAIAPPIDASVADSAAPPDAPVMHVWTVIEKEGQGSCKRDADCVLSSWQSGCCTGACVAYAISNAELRKREKAENCPKPGTQLCPPPAPCPKPTQLPIDAFCKAKKCWAHFTPAK